MNPSNKIKTIDSQAPNLEILKKASAVIEQGGIVVFPTQCLYGLAADALNAEAVSEIFRIKGRPPDKPVLVLIKSQKVLQTIVEDIPPAAHKLISRFWPGSLTIIFPAQKKFPSVLTGKTGKIGVRLPGHPVASALAKLSNNPITGTSANVSGTPGCSDIDRIDPKILRETELVLDAGPLAGGIGSTVLDITGEKVVVLREGVVSAEQIFSCLGSD